MKSSGQTPREAHCHRTEAIIAEHVHQLFERMPMLSGFWLRPDFEVAELSVFTWPGHTLRRDLCEDVIRSLVELAEGRPDAVPLIRGRTFARALH